MFNICDKCSLKHLADCNQSVWTLIDPLRQIWFDMCFTISVVGVSANLQSGSVCNTWLWPSEVIWTVPTNSGCSVLFKVQPSKRLLEQAEPPDHIECQVMSSWAQAYHGPQKHPLWPISHRRYIWQPALDQYPPFLYFSCVLLFSGRSLRRSGEWLVPLTILISAWHAPWLLW